MNWFTPLCSQNRNVVAREERGQPKGPLVALQRPEPESGALAVGQYHDIPLTCEGQHPVSTLRVLLHHTAGVCWVLNPQVPWSAASIFTFNDFVKTNLFFTVLFFFFFVSLNLVPTSLTAWYTHTTYVLSFSESSTAGNKTHSPHRNT